MTPEVKEALQTLTISLAAFVVALALASVIYWNWRIWKIVRKVEVIVDDVSEQERMQKL